MSLRWPLGRKGCTKCQTTMLSIASRRRDLLAVISHASGQLGGSSRITANSYQPKWARAGGSRRNISALRAESYKGSISASCLETRWAGGCCCSPTWVRLRPGKGRTNWVPNQRFGLATRLSSSPAKARPVQGSIRCRGELASISQRLKKLT